MSLNNPLGYLTQPARVSGLGSGSGFSPLPNPRSGPNLARVPETQPVQQSSIQSIITKYSIVDNDIYNFDEIGF